MQYYDFESRRINKEHRLVYKIKDDSVFIAQLRLHYWGD
jgi:toxin YoeB